MNLTTLRPGDGIILPDGRLLRRDIRGNYVLDGDDDTQTAAGTTATQ